MPGEFPFFPTLIFFLTSSAALYASVFLLAGKLARDESAIDALVAEIPYAGRKARERIDLYNRLKGAERRLDRVLHSHQGWRGQIKPLAFYEQGLTTYGWVRCRNRILDALAVVAFLCEDAKAHAGAVYLQRESREAMRRLSDIATRIWLIDERLGTSLDD